MEFEFVECRRSYIKEICKNLREEDRRELEEMSGCSPLKELLRCRLYSQKDERWAIVSSDKILMVFGLYKMGIASSSAKMWMACCKDISLANKFILQEMCGVVITALMKYKTLYGDIDKRHKKAVQFFKRVGCELTDGEAITGLPIYCARLTRELFIMSKANRWFRRNDFKIEYVGE